ncbi:hypothetical protein X797_008762 [Metarhizium robertsii]|uniref:Uncharacterized protein n=1 Tax=Metarhizium robertsii TaxID=568076 RepID=A0A0A1URN6_9HYPO|nr:hypothetical protein X797_008762 [Metarhizium robertsii]
MDHSEAQSHGVKAPLTSLQERNALGSEIMHLRSITQYETRLFNLTRENCRLQTEIQHLHYVRSFEKQNADKQIKKLSAELLALKHLKPLGTPRRIVKVRNRQNLQHGDSAGLGETESDNTLNVDSTY